MVFAANQTFVGLDPQGNRFVVPSRMRHSSRRREVPYYLQWFRERGFQQIELDFDQDDFLEGGGDLLWQAPGFIWAGHGFRSSFSGVEKFTHAMASRGIQTVALQLTDPRFYHLDTCLAPLREDSVLIYPGAFSPASFEAIHAHAAWLRPPPGRRAPGSWARRGSAPRRRRIRVRHPQAGPSR